MSDDRPDTAPDDVPPPRIDARLEAPSADVAPAGTAALPGAHRGGFQRELTEPVPVAVGAPVEPDAANAGSWTPEPDVRWAPTPPVLPRSASWALALAVVALIVSLVVGWGVLIGILAAVLAVVALRRPWESRAVAVWALCLSLLSLAYSAGWLWWASTQGPLFG
ncbi:hypothetical protein [Microbacterium hominis]|uniref:DUF4190 domain-containing protein n=1 Tax=Microbacterium hominis TaxID=162426 RepID=A0A0B4D5D6_9MICO|nr:hypothetical protein [Microbacterium hominis]KIC59400.1 hypothetical protein RM52_04185 [Microbacterium hominis]